MSFGKEFGALIKRQRGIEGLTQQALAVAAFGEESAKARISGLENGKVEKPHTKTIDALVVALDISNEQIQEVLDKCQNTITYDDIFDHIDTPQKLRTSVWVEPRGSFFGFYHDAPWKHQIVRFEFFVENSDLVVLNERGSRRSIDLPILHFLSDEITAHNFIRDLYYERGPQALPLSVEDVPLKIVR